MPFDEFNTRDASRQPASKIRVGPYGQAASALQALLGDVAYFWWVFVALGTVILVTTVC